MKPSLITLVRLVVVFALGSASSLAEQPLRTVRETTNAGVAVIRVHADVVTGLAVPPLINGKFAEHLGANIYKGMEAQILVNPTFAAYPVFTGNMTPDGITKFVVDNERYNQELRNVANRQGWPAGEIDGMIQAQSEALAAFWARVGAHDAVKPSPDTGPFGGRAQRVEVTAAGQGIAQWAVLPLHRVRRFEFELFLRSPDITKFQVSLWAEGAEAVCAEVGGVSTEWKKFTGTLELPASIPAEASCKLALVAQASGQFVVQRVLLRPADHINGADPDIVRLLKDSKLPLLRWPGGNFVSAYHWRDGVGAFEKRPTLPNYAWGALEPNQFGTDEFIAFCRAVGCEPMICVNGGTGTPEEAAQWIEYCNGPADSPMGKLRAANGHPEPYHVKYWEAGNELWGGWQAHWTTPAGYADRYLRFAPAMRAADPTIQLYACGAPAMWGKNWNDTLFTRANTNMHATTDHPLVGGDVKRSVEPLDVYRDFMAVPELLQGKWLGIQRDMIQAGISEPRLAVTELQMFAHLGERPKEGPERLNGENLVNPGTQAEAVYDTLIYHAAIRIAPFVEMVTHSAIVNHGGGLRKQRERVFANPCYYAQSAFGALAGAAVLPVEIECASEKTPLVLPDLRNVTGGETYGVIDAVAARADRVLWVSVVNRGTGGVVEVAIDTGVAGLSTTAEVRLLTADAPWAANSLKEPEKIKPVDSKVAVEQGKVRLRVPAYSVARVRIAL